MSINGKQVLVLQHTEHEHLGLIAEALAYEQLKYTYLRPDLGQSIPATLGDYQGLIVMGGPQSVYEEDRFPFLGPEKALVHSAVLSNRPVLGVCLGSQILAEVLGAQIRSGEAFELGWKKVNISAEAADNFVLGHLPRVITPLHWHGDVYDLPDGAKPLGSSELTPVQGFSWNEKAYGLLFHLEMTLEQLTSMVEDFPNDLDRAGIEAAAIMTDAPSRIDALRKHGMEVFRRWTTLL